MSNKSGRRLGKVIVAIMIVLTILLFIGVPAAVLYNYMSLNYASFVADALLELIAFAMLPFAWILMHGKSTQHTIKALGLSAPKGFVKALIYLLIGGLTFLVVIALELGVSAVASLTNVQINTNVAQVFAGAPLWFYFFIAIIGPICEELFFRGFLINGVGNTLRRSPGIVMVFFGFINSLTIFLVANSFYNAYISAEVIIAAVLGFLIQYLLNAYARKGDRAITVISIINAATLFGLLHVGYGSTFSIEILAALAFGIIAGYVFVKTKSLYPAIVAHIAVDTLSVVLTFMLLTPLMNW